MAKAKTKLTTREFIEAWESYDGGHSEDDWDAFVKHIHKAETDAGCDSLSKESNINLRCRVIAGKYDEAGYESPEPCSRPTAESKAPPSIREMLANGMLKAKKKKAKRKAKA